MHPVQPDQALLFDLPAEARGLTPEHRALLDASPESILVADERGRIVASNERLAALFQVTPAVLEGQLLEVLLPERLRGAHAAARSAYTDRPSVRRMGSRPGLVGRRRDGTEFPVEIALSPILGSAGGLVMAVVREVAPGRASGALNAIGDAVLMTDPSGQVDFLNRAAEELTGMTSDAARGRPLDEVLPLVSEATGEPLPSVAMTGGPPRPGELSDAILPGRAGEASRALDLSTTLLRDASGAVTGVVVVARDVTHARLLLRQLSHQATHDALTGLVNRSEFERRLMRALEGAAEELDEHAVCYVDLDGFKRINDACGHLAGDELLRQLSELMRSRMRSRDTLARLGGDEFGVLLEHCRLPRAKRIADGLRQAVSNYRFTFGQDTYGLAASIGIVRLRGGMARPSDVLRAADAACYLAKRSGGNRIQVAIPRRRAAGAPRDEEWARRVALGLESNSFRLYLQPVLALEDLDLPASRFEVLLRMEDGGAGPLAARAFLPAARRQRLMPAIDHWVVQETLDRLARWQLAHPGAGPTLLAINLDDETVTAGKLMPHLERELVRTGILPELLCFELSDTVVGGHPVASARLVRALRELGCHTALEHGGSGMAAFTLLRRLQPDYLKIAGHIVRALATDAVPRALAGALNDVAHALGMKTIGAQVEGAAALSVLRQIGVDYAQGFGIAHPGPFDEMLAPPE